MQSTLDFDGKTFDREKDGRRLSRQLDGVRDLMKDGLWRTLGEIESATGYPQPSISARLRDLRKLRHGGHVVSGRRRAGAGTWEYSIYVLRPD